MEEKETERESALQEMEEEKSKLPKSNKILGIRQFCLYCFLVNYSRSLFTTYGHKVVLSTRSPFTSSIHKELLFLLLPC